MRSCCGWLERNVSRKCAAVAGGVMKYWSSIALTGSRMADAGLQFAELACGDAFLFSEDAHGALPCIKVTGSLYLRLGARDVSSVLEPVDYPDRLRVIPHHMRVSSHQSFGPLGDG